MPDLRCIYLLVFINLSDVESLTLRHICCTGYGKAKRGAPAQGGGAGGYGQAAGYHPYSRWAHTVDGRRGVCVWRAAIGVRVADVFVILTWKCWTLALDGKTEQYRAVYEQHEGTDARFWQSHKPFILFKTIDICMFYVHFIKCTVIVFLYEYFLAARTGRTVNWHEYECRLSDICGLTVQFA